MAKNQSAIADAFGLSRNTIAVAVAMFLMALGENLWTRFMPKYLQSLGAPVTAIGFFGTCEDLLDGLYQYPGGWIADRYGRRLALLLFVSLAMIGYAIYLFAPSWPFIFAGLVFVLAWSSMASPALFAVIGDVLPKERRARGFTVQAILRRLPIAIAPTLGGLAIAAYGLWTGMHLALIVTLLLAAVTLLIVSRINITIATDQASGHMLSVWHSLPEPLRWLLASDIFIRTCEGLVDVFLVLYALNVVGISAPAYGVLIAVQMITAILSYIPAASMADRLGRKPLVVATFVAFAIFPVAVVLARDFRMLVAAFIIGGLREMGEPARKAMIVDLAEPALRARSIGLYYFIRSLAISPAAFIGGLLWSIAPSLPFWMAGVIGAAGVAVFLATVNERYAS